MRSARLIADVGGTNIRFARATEGEVSGIFRIAWDDVGSFLGALDAFLARDPERQIPIHEVVIDVAAPVSDGTVKLTNRDVVLSADAISERLDGVPVTILNDLEAVALALPHLTPDDYHVLRTGHVKQRARSMVAVNVGTGFGSSAVISTPHGWVAVPSESGHMVLAPVSDDAADIIGGCETVEDYVSGRGLAALKAKHGPHPILDPNSEIFARHLGRVAGDITLATGSWGGVFLVGGVLDGWDMSERSLSAFFAGFDAKGRMSGKMAHVPVHLVTRSNPTLLGLANFNSGRLPGGAASGTRPRIALVAHDALKDKMVNWVAGHLPRLADAEIFCTGTTGQRLHEKFPELDLTRFKSGPLGGDQQIGAKICQEELDALIFFVDPLSPMPHDVDVKALTRLAAVYDIPTATSRSTADAIVQTVLRR